MNRFVAALAACFITAVLAVVLFPLPSTTAAPLVGMGELTRTIVYSDTLPHVGAAGNTDSCVTSTPISIDGARIVIAYVTTDSVDTLSFVPTAQWLPFGTNATTWRGTGMMSGGTLLAPTNAVTTVNISRAQGNLPFVVGYGSVDGTAGGAPSPTLTGQLRFRLKATEARRYTQAQGLGWSSSGRITVTVDVIK